MHKESKLNEKIRLEFAKFKKIMEEFHLLKGISHDLKNYKQMIEIKKYD